MTTESMRVAKLITEDNLGDPISISEVMKVCTSLIHEATDVANSINHFQGRSEYKIDPPSLTEGIHKVPDGFYQDERIPTRMLIEQYNEYRDLYNKLLQIRVVVAV